MSIRIAVRTFPGRKKPSLVIEEGTEGIVVATFQDDAAAEMYQKILGGNLIVEGKSLKNFKEHEEHEGDNQTGD
jgi:hypothetical protein